MKIDKKLAIIIEVPYFLCDHDFFTDTDNWHLEVLFPYINGNLTSNLVISVHVNAFPGPYQC